MGTDMVNLADKNEITKIIAGITDESEVTRRAEAYRRQLIYKDGGKRFLLEQIRREFNEDAIKEMRLCPINLLKKIVNKRAAVYKKPPIRTTLDANDQALVDFYVREMKLDMAMQKANRYFILHANCALYTVPDMEGEIKMRVIPPYMYSIAPAAHDRTVVDVWSFSSFTESGRVTNTVDQSSATGVEGFSREPGYQKKDDLIDSKKRPTDSTSRNFILWSASQHATVDEDGDYLQVEGQTDKVVDHGLGRAPVVNLAKDRDNEAWACDGEDMIDLTMAIQSGWTDLLTIAKQQGFSILTMVSEKRPEKMTLGVNKAVWLKVEKDGPRPELDYKSGSANLGEYRQLLMELLGLLLSTNDMNPKSIGGQTATQQFTSGMHALIEMSDTLSAIEDDKPILMEAELEEWEVIKAWHNSLFDADKLESEAKDLGKFSDAFELSIVYQDVKALESEKERVDLIKELKDLRLITRQKSMKKLYPEMTNDQIDAELAAIDAESVARVKMVSSSFGQAAAATAASPTNTNPMGMQGDQAGAQSEPPSGVSDPNAMPNASP